MGARRGCEEGEAEKSRGWNPHGCYEGGGKPFYEGCFPCVEGLLAFVPVVSLGCKGSELCWILSPGGWEGEAWRLGLELLVLLEGLLLRRKQRDPAVASCSGNSERKVSGCSDHSRLHPGALIGIAACVSSGLQPLASLPLPKFGKESKDVALKG